MPIRLALGTAIGESSVLRGFLVNAQLQADLTSQPVPPVLTLAGATAGRTFDDYLGNSQAMLVDEAGFEGAQYVANLHTSADDPTAWTYTGANGTDTQAQTDLIGGTSAVRMKRTQLTNGFNAKITLGADVTDFIASVWVRWVAGTGKVSIYGTVLTAYTYDIPKDGEWYRIATPVVASSLASIPWQIALPNNADGGVQNDELDFCRGMIEKVTNEETNHPDELGVHLPREWLDGVGWVSTEVASVVDMEGIVIDAQSPVPTASVEITSGYILSGGVIPTYGYSDSLGIGSLDPTALTIGGCRVRTMEYYSFIVNQFRVVIDNPYGTAMHPQNLFDSITINGRTLYTDEVSVTEGQTLYGRNSEASATSWVWDVPVNFLADATVYPITFGLNPGSKRDIAMKKLAVEVTTGASEYGFYSGGEGSVDVSEVWDYTIESIGDGVSSSDELAITLSGTTSPNILPLATLFYKVVVDATTTFLFSDATMTKSGAEQTWTWTGTAAGLSLATPHDFVFYEKPFDDTVVNEGGPIGYSNTVENLTFPTSALLLNDFKIEFDWTPTAAPPTTGHLFGSYLDVNNRFQLKTAGIVITATKVSGGTSAGASSIPSVVAGITVPVVVELDSTLGMRLTVGGSTLGWGASSAFDISGGATFEIGNSGNAADDTPIDGSIRNFRVIPT